jgi:hypothetical protein
VKKELNLGELPYTLSSFLQAEIQAKELDVSPVKSDRVMR